ncbi:MAG: protein kinase [Rhodanobacteraceae bacterium]|nr:protein kinase [Rhodanobacteraceae bacterium]
MSEPTAPLAATLTGQFAASDLPPQTRIADRYRIERLLGMGAMGLVYEAVDEQLDVRVALKVLRPELARRPDAFARFRQELLLARQVSSPHVVRIHDLVQHGETWMISMDFIAGRSLEARIDEGTPLPLDEALRIARQLALGLAAAQARGVVHRDLKPANVLLDEQGNAYISDFGVARAAGATRMTGTGMVVGTPDYLSPEQARADELDGRSDQYALGLILREMLTGQLPFAGGTAAEMLTQRVLNDAPSLAIERPDLPLWVVTLCDRLLRRRAAQRFADSAEIAAVIEQARVAPAPGERIGWPRTRLLIVAATVIALIAGAWYLQRDPVPATLQVAAPPSLDIVVLPFTAADAATREMAQTATVTLVDALQAQATPTSADPERVAHALAALGFDAANAGEHLDRVAGELRATTVLRGELVVAAEGMRLRVTAQRGDAAEPTWVMVSPAFDAAGADAAIAAFVAQVQSRFGVALPADAVGEGRDAALAWRELSGLEARARSLDARSRARELLDAHGPASSPRWQRLKAYASLLVGDADTAVQILAPLVSVLPQDHPARIVLARARAERGEFEQAVTDLRALVEEDERSVEAWFLLGKFAIMQGDAKSAVDDYLVRALVLAKRFDDARWRAEIANAFGVGYRNLGQMSEAAEEYEAAIRARHALGDARGEAVSRRNLAVAYAYLGRHDDADAQLVQARALLEPLGDAAAMADVVNDAGVLAEERGDFRVALDAFREALGFRQTQGDQRLIGESLINVGFAYYQVGEFDNALVYWRQADQVYAAIDDASGAVRAQQSLALAEIAQGDVVAARRSLDASLHRAEELQMAEERAVALVSRAELDRVEGHFADAHASALQARDLFVALDDQRGRIESVLVAIQSLLEVGDAAAAAALLATLPEDAIASREQRAQRAQRDAELALLQSDGTRATQAAAHAIALADASRSLAQSLSGRILLAEAEFTQGDPRRAARTLADAREHLARYASVPLRLRLLEAELRIAPDQAAARYREARSELARWPQYGRAWHLHSAALVALRQRDGVLAKEAGTAAALAATALQSQTPIASRDATSKWLDATREPAP